MRVLVYADFRSPHARGWALGLEQCGIEVVRCSSEAGGIELGVDSAASGGRLRQEVIRARTRSPRLGAVLRALAGNQVMHSAYAGARAPRRIAHLRQVSEQTDPDLVHALRIPYEGLVALSAIRDVPVVASCWGLDFDPQASEDPLLRAAMRRMLPRLSGLHVDDRADAARATSFGMRPNTPILHAPGNFGVDTSLFLPGAASPQKIVFLARRPAPHIATTQALGPLVTLLERRPDVVAWTVGLSPDELHRSRQLEELLQEERVVNFSNLTQPEFAFRLRSASVILSPSRADGMPNTVLEGLHCGRPVVAGHLPQLRELSTICEALTLVDLDRAEMVVAALESALEASSKHWRVPEQVREFCDRTNTGMSVREFYAEVLGRRIDAGTERSDR